MLSEFLSPSTLVTYNPHDLFYPFSLFLSLPLFLSCLWTVRGQNSCPNDWPSKHCSWTLELLNLDSSVDQKVTPSRCSLKVDSGGLKKESKSHMRSDYWCQIRYSQKGPYSIWLHVWRCKTHVLQCIRGGEKIQKSSYS